MAACCQQQLANGASLDLYTVEPGLPKSELAPIERVAQLYGPSLTKVSVLPNHHIGRNDSYPRGTATHFRDDSAMFPEPFHADSFMTAGASLYKITGPVPDESFWQDPARQHVKKLLAAVAPSSENALSLERRDPDTNRDRSGLPAYQPVIEEGSNTHVQLCRGTRTHNNELVKEYYILVTGGLPQASRALLKQVEQRRRIEAPPVAPSQQQRQQQAAAASSSAAAAVPLLDGTRKERTTLTMREFLTWPQTAYVVQLGQRNRARIAALVAQALNLNVPTIVDAAVPDQRVMVAVPFNETTHYHLEAVGDNTLVYFAETARTDTVRGGLLMQLAPTLGAELLFGETCANNAMGGGWAKRGTSNAFPTTTGRTREVHEAYESAMRTQFRFNGGGSSNNATTDTAASYGWHGQLQFNDRFDPTSYRSRNKQFVACEQRLGRDPALDGMRLSPLLQIVSATPAHKVSAAKAQA